jgi:DNA-binding beta-propeller fold protein YncE
MPIVPVKRAIVVLAVVASLVSVVPSLSAASAQSVSPAEANFTFSTRHLGTFDSGSGNAGAEVAVHDPATGRVFVTNGARQAIDVFSVSTLNPAVRAAPIATVDVGGDVTSVAVSGGVVAAAVAADPVTDQGEVVFFDADVDVTEPVEVSRATVGSLPDMVTFTPDGLRVIVANEGEPRCVASNNPAEAVNPEGSVSIVDLATGRVRTAGFGRFEGFRAELEAAGLRLNWPGATLAEDVEPEYITVAPDGSYAYVTLQEANAVATVDLATATVTDIFPLGLKDHSLPGNGLDPSDRDLNGTLGRINIANFPLFGTYMPDAIDSFRVAGRTYLATANEGDGREYGFAESSDCFLDEKRLSTMVGTTNPYIPGASTLRTNAVAGRIKVIATNLTTYFPDGAALVPNRLTVYGARSFSIWDSATGSLVSDSGDAIEQAVAAENPEYFNANFEWVSGGFTSGGYAFDTRSDDKGPEPEAVTIGEVFGRLVAFVGLERAGGFMAFDVTDPANPEYLLWERSTTNYVPSSAPQPLAQLGDISPESVYFVPAADSPTGLPLVIVSYELSGTTSVFELVPPAGSTPAGAVGDVDVDPYNRSLEVSWSSPTTAGSFPVTGYQVVASPGGHVCSTGPNSTSCRLTGLTNGTTYSLTVRATTLIGPGVQATGTGTPGYLAEATSLGGVPRTAYFAEAVDWLSARGAVRGVGTTNQFGGNRTLTRAEFATILWRLAGEPSAASGCSFSDVAPGGAPSWFTDAACWLGGRAVFTGRGGDPATFDPSSRMTRGQAVVVLWRVAGRPGAEAGISEAVTAQAWAVETGIVTGGSLREANAGVTRAQAVAMVERLATTSDAWGPIVPFWVLF